jgi:hypothetical protein
MRSQVHVLPGPPPAMTSANAGRRVRSFVRRQCAGSRTLTWLPFLVVDVLLQGCAHATVEGFGGATRPRERPQADHRRPVVGLAGPPLLAAHHRAIKTATVEGAQAVGPSGRRRHPDRARQARPPGSTVDERDAALAGPCPPARRVGRSLATRPRAVTPSDPPARGDQPSAPDRDSDKAHRCSCWPKPDNPRPCTPQTCDPRCRRAASKGGRSTATATCGTWSTAPGRWRRSWTGCGGSGGRASAAPSEKQWAMPLPAGRRCRGAPLGWCHAAPRTARSRTYYPGLQDPQQGMMAATPAAGCGWKGLVAALWGRPHRLGPPNHRSSRRLEGLPDGIGSVG